MSITTEPRDCPDCGVAPNEAHTDHCDVARCLASGGQRLQCELGDETLELLFGAAPARTPHECGQDVWTGVWPGVAECIELGWYTYFRAPAPGEQYGEWVRCAADDPRAGADLNRLNGPETVWDAIAHRFVKRDGSLTHVTPQGEHVFASGCCPLNPPWPTETVGAPE